MVDILTFGQGTRILVDTLVFLILFFIYLKFTNEKPFFTNLFFTLGLFVIWAFSIVIINNIVLALSVPLNRGY